MKRRKYFYVLFWNKPLSNDDYSHPVFRIFEYGQYKGQRDCLCEIEFQTDKKYGHHLTNMYGGNIRYISLNSLDKTMRFLTKFNNAQKEWYFDSNFAKGMVKFFKRHKIERRYRKNFEFVSKSEL